MTIEPPEFSTAPLEVGAAERSIGIPESAAPDEMLGLSASSAGELTVDKVYKSKSTVTIVINYLQSVIVQNVFLRNENNTLRTYQLSYERNRGRAKLSAVLMALSNLATGIGVAMYFEADAPGLNEVGVIVLGIAALLGALYLTLWDA